MYAATVSTYVEMVLELDPRILTSSSSSTLARRYVRAALTSNKQGRRKAEFNNEHHLKMQGGPSLHQPTSGPRTGRYGPSHFPLVAEFPKGHMSLANVCKEFTECNPYIGGDEGEAIAWFYHRIRALLAKFIKTKENQDAYDTSELGQANRERARLKKPEAKSTAQKENVGSSRGTTLQTGEGSSKRSSSWSPCASRRGEPFSPSSPPQTATSSKAPAPTVAKKKRTGPSVLEVSDDVLEISDDSGVSEQQQREECDSGMEVSALGQISSS
jgi:hypothetical protein